MTLTSDRLDELRQRLVALRTRFGEVGARAAAAAGELGDSVAPAEALVEELRGKLGREDEAPAAPEPIPVAAAPQSPVAPPPSSAPPAPPPVVAAPQTPAGA